MGGGRGSGSGRHCGLFFVYFYSCIFNNKRHRSAAIPDTQRRKKIQIHLYLPTSPLFATHKDQPAALYNIEC